MKPQELSQQGSTHLSWRGNGRHRPRACRPSSAGPLQHTPRGERRNRQAENPSVLDQGAGVFYGANMSNSKNFNHVAKIHGVVTELLIAREHVRQAGDKLVQMKLSAWRAQLNADLRAGKIIMRHDKASVPPTTPIPDSILDLMHAIQQQVIEISQL